MEDITRFEVDKTYTTRRGLDTITVSRRTDKTIWFCEDMFSARIEIIEDIETVSPTIGVIRPFYKADRLA